MTTLLDALAGRLSPSLPALDIDPHLLLWAVLVLLSLGQVMLFWCLRQATRDRHRGEGA